MKDDVLLVLTSLPDKASAGALASHLIEAQLAACVSLLAPATSVFRWEGKMSRELEVPALIKTTQSRYAALEAAIRDRHPNELPEIIAVPVTHGLPAYLDWVGAETHPNDQN